MDARARRGRLPRALRFAALPVLIAIAGALVFGFAQSNAAPTPTATAAKKAYLQAPVLPKGVDPNNLPRHQLLNVDFLIGFDCPEGDCAASGPRNTYEITVVKEDNTARKKWNGRLSGTASRESGERYVSRFSIQIPADALATGGTYRIAQVYGADDDRFSISSRFDRYTVNDKYTPAWRVVSTPEPSKVGDEVTFTATYAGTAAPQETKPTGALFFKRDGVGFGSANLDAMGNARLKTKALPVGKLSISVGYLGASNSEFHDLEDTFGTVHTVTKKGPVATATTLTSITPNPAVAWTIVTIKAKVTAESGEPPTGRVRIVVWHARYGTRFEPTVQADGTVEVPYQPDFAGDDQRVTAEYLPTGDFAPSTAPEGRLTVTRAESKTTVTAKPENAAPGTPVTLTATVDPHVDEGIGPDLDGIFTFTDGETVLGTCIAEERGTCALTTDKLAPGRRTVTATFDGGRGLAKSTGTTSVRVFQRSTTTLTAGPSTVTEGSTVTMTAQVAGADPKITTPYTGTVTFLDGSTELGKSEVDKEGKATLSIATLAVGTHTLTARYGGSDALEPSDSAPASVQVSKPTTPDQGGGGGGGGSDPQPRPLPTTGVSVLQPIGIGALLLILGAVGITLGRKRRRTR